MTFLSRVDEGFGAGLEGAGPEVPGGRVEGVFRPCVEGLVVVPVCCGGESASGSGWGVGATVKVSLFEFDELSAFDDEAVFAASEFEFDCA
jgi:hypothetical protein